MKTLATLLALAIFCATGHGQTIKSLGFNTTNGEVVANTGTNVLTFTNAFTVATNAVAQVRTNLGLGSLSVGTFSAQTNLALKVSTNLVVTNGVIIANNIDAAQIEAVRFFVASTDDAPIGFEQPEQAVKFVRALAGSTNTNEPFSGAIDIIDGNEETHNITISNGIILNWLAP
jgi:adhesin HecA-like repeat protein